MTGRLPSCTGCTGWRSTWLPSGRCCSRWTMRSGRTGRRCGGWPISRPGSTASAIALIVALRPSELVSVTSASLSAVRAQGSVVRPRLLSEPAVDGLVRATVGGGATDALCAAVWAASGGNPFYVTELLRALEFDERSSAELDPRASLAAGVEAVASRVLSRVRAGDPRALGLAQVLAVLGDGCELRQAAAIAGVETSEAARLAAGLVRLEILGDRRPAGLPASGDPRCAGGVAGTRRARCGSSSGRAPPACRRSSAGPGGRASRPGATGG